MTPYNLGQAIKTIAMDAVERSDPTDWIYGTVVSVAPLRVQIEQKITLESVDLQLSSLVSDFAFEMTVDHETQPENAHTHPVLSTYTDPSVFAHKHSYAGRKTFTVHLGLVLGERVILLRQRGGQKFLVLDRVRS